MTFSSPNPENFNKLKLLEQFHSAITIKQYSVCTEEAYDDMGIQSPVDRLWSTYTELFMAFKNLPSDLEDRFFEVVTRRYKGDLQAVIMEFLKLHGK